MLGWRVSFYPMLSLMDWGHLLQEGKRWKFVQREIWQRATAPSRKGLGRASCWHGKALPVGSGSWQQLSHGICCLWKPGEGDWHTRAGFGSVSSKDEVCVVLDPGNASSWPRPPGSPWGPGCTWRGASSSETFHINDPMLSLTCSLLSPIPFCSNTPMQGMAVIPLTAAAIFSLGLQAKLAAQLLEKASFPLDKCLWTLSTLLHCEYRCCKTPIWRAVIRYVNALCFLRKKKKDKVITTYQ